MGILGFSGLDVFVGALGVCYGLVWGGALFGFLSGRLRVGWGIFVMDFCFVVN